MIPWHGARGRRGRYSWRICHSVVIRVVRNNWCIVEIVTHIRLRELGKSEDKVDKASVRKEVDLEEYHSVAEMDLPIAKEGMQMQSNGYHKRDRRDGKCRGKVQVPRQGRWTEAKELHKTDVDGLLIKIAETEGLRVDAGALDQGTK
ncbi:hypothetical protein BHM03_00037173 [Ensete ventricosum]|nr:hypothetical protein BHM03_00037173 [Ensete ventricosum]